MVFLIFLASFAALEFILRRDSHITARKPRRPPPPIAPASSPAEVGSMLALARNVNEHGRGQSPEVPAVEEDSRKIRDDQPADTVRTRPG